MLTSTNPEAVSENDRHLSGVLCRMYIHHPNRSLPDDGCKPRTNRGRHTTPVSVYMQCKQISGGDKIGSMHTLLYQSPKLTVGRNIKILFDCRSIKITKQS